MTATASITISYVNPPKGRGPGTVKDTQGRYWQVWPDKLAEFYGAEGQEFFVTYQTKSYQGKRQDTIIAAVPMNGGGDGQAPAPQPRRAAAPRPPLPESEKQVDISVLSLLSSTKWGEKIPVGDLAALSHALRTLRRAWLDHKAPANPSPTPVRRPPIPVPQVPLSEEMNDDIPYFDEDQGENQEPMNE